MFYETLKAVHGPTHQIWRSLRCSDSQVHLIDTAPILSLWSKYCQASVSVNGVVQEYAILIFQQQPVGMELDELPTLENTIGRIGRLKRRRIEGVNGIQAEIWRHGGSVLHVKLHKVLFTCLEQGKLSRDLRAVVIITLYKNKRVKSHGSNCRGITLISYTGKILSKLLKITQKPMGFQSQ